MSKKQKQIENKSDGNLLSPAHTAFVKEYVSNFGNATRAYMYAYPKARGATARVQACKLLTKHNIVSAIEQEYTRLWKDKDAEFEKSKTYQMIHVIGSSNIADVIDLKEGTLTVKDIDDIPLAAQQAIQSIEMVEKETEHGVDRHLKVKLHPKLAALELRAKIQKMIDNKLELEGEIIIRPAVRPDRPKVEEIE